MLGAGGTRFAMLAVVAAALASVLALPAAAAAALAFPVAASAAPVPFTVAYPGSGEGEVWCKVTEPGEEPLKEEICDGPWPANTRIAFEKPQPEAGSEFKGYEGTGSAAGCAKACSFKLTEPSSVAVRFELIVRTLSIGYSGDGLGEVEVVAECETFECEIAESAYPGGVEYTYAKGAELTLAPQIWPGFEFFAGFQDAEGSAAPCMGQRAECSFALETDSSLDALFERIELTVEKRGTGQGTVSSEGGEIACGATCTAPFEEGEEVLLTAAPAPGSAFAGWSGCASAPASGECAITIGPESAALAATFDVDPTPTSITPPTPTPTPPPTPEPEPERAGTATAAGSASVSGGKAALKIACTGG